MLKKKEQSKDCSFQSEIKVIVNHTYNEHKCD